MPSLDDITVRFLGSTHRASQKISHVFFANLIQKTIALILFILSVPALLFFALLIRLRMGGPVFYKGTRLGYLKKPFIIYKLRTLPLNFHQENPGKLVDHENGKLSLLQKFLRDTRIDELPQLINIINGDMNFIGARPIRQELYEICCKHIKGYDKRFSVKPGLIGYSQLYTPHGTPKRLRSLIDNRSLERSITLTDKSKLLGTTLLSIVSKISQSLYRLVVEKYIKVRLCHLYSEKRKLHRVPTRQGNVELLPGELKVQELPFETNNLGAGILQNMNETHMKITLERDVPVSDASSFCIRCSCLGGKKYAYCRGEIRSKHRVSQTSSYAYIIAYEALTPLNQYMIDQYFLNKSLTHHGI